MNKFLKLSLKALTLPIFIIRVIYGALIRYIPSCFLLVFSLPETTEAQTQADCKSCRNCDSYAFLLFPQIYYVSFWGHKEQHTSIYVKKRL